MIDYRRRLSSCDLSSVPEIRDGRVSLLKSGGQAARSPEHADSSFELLLKRTFLTSLKQRIYEIYYYNLWFLVLYL